MLAGPLSCYSDISLRSSTQDDFINDDCKVVCATYCFWAGSTSLMCAEESNITLPVKSIRLLPEIGRAGRDGLPSETILLKVTAI
jgi:ATP-dependent DNA helicase RecQ